MLKIAHTVSMLIRTPLRVTPVERKIARIMSKTRGVKVTGDHQIDNGLKGTTSSIEGFHLP